MKINGTYSGAVFAESYLELDFVGAIHENGLPYTYSGVGSYVNWSSEVLLNGATETWVRLPWVGDPYEYITLSLWEVDDYDTTMSVDAMENGTRASVTGSNAAKVYQTYWGFDWWELGGFATPLGRIGLYNFPDEFDEFPWSLDAVPGAINHCDESITAGGVYCFGATDVSSYLHPDARIMEAPYMPDGWMDNAQWNFDIEYSGDRWYANIHHFIKPDQKYFIASTAILKNQTKPVIALTEESTNGGNFNSTINNGLLNEFGKWEESDELEQVELGWSFIFTGGHGAGLTGIQIPARFNQTVWFQAHLEPAEEFQNLSITLPVLYEGTDPYHYCYVAMAFHGDGSRATWELANVNVGGPFAPYSFDDELGGGVGSIWSASPNKNLVNGCMGQRNGLYQEDIGFGDTIIKGQYQQSMVASDFIKFTVGHIPCEDAAICSNTQVYAYTPEVGAEYYTIGITFNPYIYCFESQFRNPECAGGIGPMDCNIPVGSSECYEGPHEYRLLGVDGDDGFMVSDTCIGTCNYYNTETSMMIPMRLGGSTYSYNLAVEVVYTEGFWLYDCQYSSDGSPLPGGDCGYAVPFADTVYDMRTSVASGNTNSQCFFSTANALAGNCHNLFEIADVYWAQVDWNQPGTWGAMLKAMKFMIAGMFIEIWNGMQSMSGTLMGGFVHSIEAVAELGHWLVINLPKIVDTIINASVWILDNVDLILETMLIGLGAWLFYFVLRVLLLITSHVKLAILRGPFE